MSTLSAMRLPEGQASLRDARCLEIVDCLQLPHTIEWHRITTTDEAFNAIKSMRIRGAPAIASLAAVSIAIELLEFLDDPSCSTLQTIESLRSWLEERSSFLLSSRPTAVNLREAMHRLQAIASSEKSSDVRARALEIYDAAELVWTEDVERNIKIGDNGAAWLLKRLEDSGAITKGQSINVLTVCNTGSLATSGYGTALGVISSLHRLGRLAHAFYAQTGPYQQGARLTSLELQSQGIPSTMIPDTAMASLLAGNSQKRPVHAFILGADRIANNGDTANKISSYQIALLAKSVPPPPGQQAARVLVCAPVATMDLGMASGQEIVIEERPSWEACTVRGKIYHHDPSSQKKATSEATKLSAKQNGDVSTNQKSDVVTVLVTPEATTAWNPAFDVTPAELIDGIASELGVADKDAKGSFNLTTYVNRRSRIPENRKREFEEADAAGGANGLPNGETAKTAGIS